MQQLPPSLPTVEEVMKPSCARWKMVAYPVLNDGSDFVVRSANGMTISNAVKDLTVVRFCCPSDP